jgi:hypothetical protein
VNSDYFEKISRAFLTESGRGLMLSPKDHKWVEQWYRAAIPSDVVVTGIKEAFSQPPKRRVNSLAFVALAVERAAQSHRIRKVGVAIFEGDDTLLITDRLTDLLSQIRQVASSHTEPKVIDLLVGTSEKIEAITRQWKRIPEFNLGAALDELEEGTLKLGLDVMPSSDKEGLEADVSRILSDHPPMQPSVYAETRQAFTERRIRRYLGIPTFDCTSGGGW